MISVSRVTKSYGSGTARVRALDDVSLAVRQGEIFGVVGQSGAGKSTLIRAINSLEGPDSGSVTVDGGDMTTLEGAELRAARHNIGMIFQHFNLLSSRTVQANVELSPEIPVPAAGSAVRAPWKSWSLSACMGRPPPIPRSCPAARSSGWASPARWRPARPSSSAMRQHRHWTLKRRSRSWT